MLLSKKRKGGLHQRMQAAKRTCEPSASEGNSSSLAQWLKEQWSWGQLSPQTVQHVAALATRDMVAAEAGSIPADLLQLSKLGSEGSHPNNCHRDLLALVADVSKLPKPFPIIMPMKVQGDKALQSIFLPHVVFHHLWVHYKDHWMSSFLPTGKAGLVCFWNNFQHHPCMHQHPVTAEARVWAHKLFEPFQKVFLFQTCFHDFDMFGFFLAERNSGSSAPSP